MAVANLDEKKAAPRACRPGRVRAFVYPVATRGLWKLWLVAAAVFVLGHAWFYKLRKSFPDVI